MMTSIFDAQDYSATLKVQSLLGRGVQDGLGKTWSQAEQTKSKHNQPVASLFDLMIFKKYFYYYLLSS